MREGEWMDDKSRELFKFILQERNKVNTASEDEKYVQLSECNNVVLAFKEDLNSISGFSFLVLHKNEKGEEIFRGMAEEFQNANTVFVLRANLHIEN